MTNLKKIARKFDPAILDRMADRLANSDPDAAAAAAQRAADLRAGAVPASNQLGK